MRTGAGGQLGTGAWAIAGQVFEQTQAISCGCHGGGREPDRIADDFADEGICPGLIEWAACYGLFNRLCIRAGVNSRDLHFGRRNSRK